jgi:hypothetical protein
MKPGPALASEWAAWMRASYGPDAESVVDFATSDLDFLYGKSGTKARARGFAVEPSPRSWAAVARVLKAAGRLGISGMPLQRVIAGLVGADLAASFKKYKLPVKAQELLDSGLKALEGKLNRLTREQLIGLMGGLSRLLSDRLGEEKVCELALDFAEWMSRRVEDKDLVLAFLRELVQKDEALEGDPETRAALLTNTRLMQAVTRQHSGSGGILARLARRPALQKWVAEAAWGSAGVA